MIVTKLGIAWFAFNDTINEKKEKEKEKDKCAQRTGISSKHIERLHNGCIYVRWNYGREWVHVCKSRLLTGSTEYDNSKFYMMTIPNSIL